MTVASGSMINSADRAAWLAERMNGIGSSEAAAAIGVSPYPDSTPVALYLRKIGAAPPVAENEAMRWGTRLEPLIAEAYSEQTGETFVAAQLFVRSPVHSFMTATLDRVRADGRIVELKLVGARSAHLWGEAGSDEVPGSYLVQAMHQLSATGTDRMDVAALIAGTDFRIFPIERDDRVIARIEEREAEFWDRVQRRDPPPVDPDRDGAAMARLWPRAEGAAELGPVGDMLVEEWEASGAAVRLHQERRERARVSLLDALECAASARLSDGRILTRRLISVEEKQVTRHAYEYVDLRIRNPR